MLPHNHFIIAGLAIAPVSVALFPGQAAEETVRWVFVGGLLSAAIDLDVMLLVIWKSKSASPLRRFKNPFEIYRHFDLFMDTITATGVLKTAMRSHLAIAALMIALPYLLGSAYFVPAALGALSHIISDIPNMRRVGRGN